MSSKIIVLNYEKSTQEDKRGSNDSSLPVVKPHIRSLQ